MFKTVKQSIDELPERITTIRLINANGDWIGIFSRDDAIKQYGDWKYDSGYTESSNTVSLWIF